MNLRVYVAAPYEDAYLVRGMHLILRSEGCEPTSTWADDANGKVEVFDAVADSAFLLGQARKNDIDVCRSHAMIVMARPKVGGEMFAEARYAATLEMPTLWTGRLSLGAFRPNVLRVNPDELKTVLRLWLQNAFVQAALDGEDTSPANVRTVILGQSGLSP